MTAKASRDDLETARVELVQAIPLYLSLAEKKQLRDFLEGVVSLRKDEVAAGFDLYQALLRYDYAPYPWKSYTDLVPFIHYAFDYRDTATAYKDDPQGFREWYDYVGSEYERESDKEDIEAAWNDYTRFGYADKWESKLYSFVNTLSSYWGDVNSSSLATAVQETVQVLCFPVFAEKMVLPILGRWSEFSDKFQPMSYFPRKLSEFRLKDIESENDAVYY